MVDDFQDMQDSSSFLDELEAEESAPPPERISKRKPKRKPKRKRKQFTSNGFLGLTSKQTFIISALFFFLVCSVGSLFMFITGKMVVTF
jgi:hypothetical protein